MRRERSSPKASAQRRAGGGSSRDLAHDRLPLLHQPACAVGRDISRARCPSLLGDAPPSDPLERLELVAQRFTSQLIAHEPELRAQLRMSLDPAPPRRTHCRFARDAQSAGFKRPSSRCESGYPSTSYATSPSRSARHSGSRPSSGSPTSPGSRERTQLHSCAPRPAPSPNPQSPKAVTTQTVARQELRGRCKACGDVVDITKECYEEHRAGSRTSRVRRAGRVALTHLAPPGRR